MERLLLALAILAALLPVADARMTTVVVGGGVSGAVDYCSAQTWNTFTNFRLDFDNTDSNVFACLSSGTETGTLMDNTTIVTPSTVSPGSGGSALYIDGDSEYIKYGNSGGYFTSQYGEVMFKFMTVGDNTVVLRPFYVNAVNMTDRMMIYFSTVGRLWALWEDNDKGNTMCEFVVGTFDLDDVYGKWVQIHAKWDTTQCTAGDGNCGSVNEMGVRYRIDANSDGDFSDGGSENWSAWAYEISAYDLEAWSDEPSTNEIMIGYNDPGNSSSDYVDDIEISNTKPSTMDN